MLTQWNMSCMPNMMPIPFSFKRSQIWLSGSGCSISSYQSCIADNATELVALLVDEELALDTLEALPAEAPDPVVTVGAVRLTVESFGLQISHDKQDIIYREATSTDLFVHPSLRPVVNSLVGRLSLIRALQWNRVSSTKKGQIRDRLTGGFGWRTHKEICRGRLDMRKNSPGTCQGYPWPTSRNRGPRTSNVRGRRLVTLADVP